MASGSNSFWGKIHTSLPQKRPHSSSNPPDPSASNPGGSNGTNSTSNGTIRTLKSALETLREGLKVFPPLESALAELVECTARLQIADHNGREYEQLAADLTGLANNLRAHLSRSNPTHTPFSIRNVARAIADQVRHIQLQQDRSRTRQYASAKEDEDDILRCYRRAEALFKQLQIDVSLCIWDVVQQQQMNTYLKELLPAEDACYNSALPAAMTKRRECTRGTRTQVLADAQTWTRGEDVAKIYWMNGMAGTGKTTIACSLCKRLEEDKQLGASFFCSRDSPTCRDVNRIVPTIAYQLGRYSIPYRRALCEVLCDNPDVAKKNIDTQFDNLITKPLGGVKDAIPRDVVVVIDALDECADVNGTKQVLDLLFRHAAELPIKFFVTSRPEPGIAARMTQQTSSARSILHLHDIEQSLVQADIRTYLTEALAPIQPSMDHIEYLTTRAGRLFIFAATVVRYISPDDESANHNRRLMTMLETTQTPSDQTYEDIDELYSMIVSEVLKGGKSRADETNMRRLVLWTVVCAREPMTMSALAELLGFGNAREVELAIKPLRSVLHVSESTGVVSTLHASFPDFLLSKERAGPLLYCDEVKHNEHLATCCFQLMKHSLRFNICQLETSYRFDKDVPDLQTRVNQAISMGLFYTCRYWGDHLLSVATPDALTPLLDEFLRHRVLFWMEVLSLKEWIGHGESILSQALSWLPTDEASSELRQFTYDARNFVTHFAGNPTSLNTPHIYLTVLAFTSPQSHVRTNYWPRTRGLLRLEGTGMEARSTALLATWTVGPAVMGIAQSSDGKRIASWCDDDTVSIWDASKGNRILGPLQNGQEEGLAEDHRYYSRDIAFSVDGTRIASGSKQDAKIRIWDAHNGNLIADTLSGHKEPVLSVAFSPDGTRIVSGCQDRTIRMWNARNGAALGNIFEGHQDAVLSVVFSPDSKRIASGSSDHTIRIWDTHSATTTVGPIEGHTDWVYSVAFSPDGLCIVSGSGDNTVIVWDSYDGTILSGPFQGHSSTISSVAFSPDGMRVVSGSLDNAICVWAVQNATLLAGPFKGHSYSVRSVLFSTDGTRVFSGSKDGTICVWDSRHRTSTAAKSSGYTGAIYSVAFSPDGTRAVSGSGDRTIRVWGTRDGRLVVGPLEGHTGAVYSVAFSPDGGRIVSSSKDCTLRTWDVLTGALIRSFKGHTDRVTSVAFSPDGSRIASGSDDRTIRVWDSQTGALAVDPFNGHTDLVKSIAFSPDGTRIISGSWDRTIRTWNVLDGTTPIWTSKTHTSQVNCVAFSSDGARVVSGSSDCTILVLNALDGTVLHGPIKGHTKWVLSVAFSPDGTRIVSGSQDRTVCVWDVQNGVVVSGPFKDHTDEVQSVAFSPDGRRIVSGSCDETIRFWEVPTAGTSHPAYFDRFTLRDDGWVTDSESQLLVWLPPNVRDGFPLPPCSGIISPKDTVIADYGNLLVGAHWHECYQGLPTTIAL